MFGSQSQFNSIKPELESPNWIIPHIPIGVLLASAYRALQKYVYPLNFLPSYKKFKDINNLMFLMHNYTQWAVAKHEHYTQYKIVYNKSKENYTI